MNEKEQNFESLKQLLQLKQHEVPPPGYFNNFSGEVISRIRAGEASRSENLTDRLQSRVPWLANFLRIFETKPGVVGAFATSLCLLLVLTVVFAERSEQAAKDMLAIAPDPAGVSANSLASVATPALAAAENTGGIVASTNPITSLQPTPTMFGQAGYASLFNQQVSFAPAR
jgi:hypothetical protein